MPAKKLLATTPHAWQKPNVSFSLVTLKVGVGPIAKEEKVEGHKYDTETNQQVRQAWVLVDDEGNEKIVPKDQVATGYETDKGVVYLNDTDKEAIEVGTKGVVDLVGFCDDSEVDSLYPDKTYLIWPDGSGHTRAFVALMEALRTTGRAGVGTCALVNSTKLIVVRWNPTVEFLVLQTCIYERSVLWDKIEQARHFAFEGGPQPAMAEIDMACQIVKAPGMSKKFRTFAATVENTYVKSMLTVIKTKAAGKKVKVPKVMAQAPQVDLLAALKASAEAVSAKPKPRRTRAKAKA